MMLVDFCTRASGYNFISRMIDIRKGHCAHLNLPFFQAFTVAIWLAGFTKTVGLEMAQKGNITCNAICPGYVLTDLIRNQLEDTAKARGISKVCY